MVPSSSSGAPLRREVDFSVRALGDDVIAIDCPNDYSRAKPSFLVADPGETTATMAPSEPGSWEIATGTLTVQVNASPPTVRIYRRGEGDPICEIRGPSPEGATVAIDRGFALYGVGANNVDRDLDRRGKSYRVHHRETGQGNNHFPWVLSAQGFGLFFDSSFPMTLDFRDRFSVDGRNIRTYYFLNGPTPAEALQRYVQLTGLPPMHPAWALGYEQSSRTWMNPGELDFVTTYFREKHIPCDGFVLLSTYGGNGGVGRDATGFHAGYLDMYQGWNVKGDYRQYNPKLLPNGGADIGMLRERGFHPIVHGYWAGDYSDPASTEQVWQDHKYLAEDGFEGWWLDGTEQVSRPWRDIVPSANMPAGWTKDWPSQEFADEHDNVWALLRAKAFYEKQRRDFSDRRVYILNRTAFTGIQRYAAGVNQGDFWSSWELMRIQTQWLLNMGLSGVMFPESDIGGHWPTDETTAELYIRWAFLNVFAPLMRSHGHNWRFRLPWGYGPENEARLLPLICLRSAMFPYNYTLLAEANRTGLPLMRAMALEFPGDYAARELWDQWMWGPSVLAAPVYEKDNCERSVYLPRGTWVHYWTMRSFEGPARITIDAPLGRDPFFLRAGGVLPLRDPTDSIPNRGDERLTLLVLPAGEGGSFVLYDDDRRTYRYEHGESSRQSFKLSPVADSGQWALDIGSVEGKHEGMAREREYRVEIPNSLLEVSRVSLDGVALPPLEPGDQPEDGSWWETLPDRVVIQTVRLAGPRRLEFGR